MFGASQTVVFKSNSISITYFIFFIVIQARNSHWGAPLNTYFHSIVKSKQKTHSNCSRISQEIFYAFLFFYFSFRFKQLQTKFLEWVSSGCFVCLVKKSIFSQNLNILYILNDFSTYPHNDKAFLQLCRVFLGQIYLKYGEA